MTVEAGLRNQFDIEPDGWIDDEGQAHEAVVYEGDNGRARRTKLAQITETFDGADWSLASMLAVADGPFRAQLLHWHAQGILPD